MSTRPQELNKIIADLRQIIVGKVAMPTDQIEQITLFLFLKQLSKKHDELVRIGSKELIFTGEWERYHFDVLLRHSGEDLVKECREAVESLYKNPHIDPTVRKVFERSYLKILEPKVLSSFLIYLNDKFSDGLDLGDFYESLLPILGTQNELGQFRTPRHIIDFIVRVVDPSIGEKIADPACGTAGFLVSAFNYLKEKYTEKGRLTLNPEQTKQLYNDTIYGWDMEPLMVKFSLANLYLHGLKVPNVSENDTLLNENLWQHTFDIIVANPPFITPKGGARRHSRFAIKSNKTEVLFSEWMVHHLNFNGRLGIIVPEGIIFDASKGHKEIRKLFLDNGLWCVVSLPSAVFQPYSGVKTSIIFLDKTLKPTNILFYKIDNHGFSLNTNPAPIDKNDLPKALEIIKDYKNKLQVNEQNEINQAKYYTVNKEKITQNPTISLSGSVYKNNIIEANSHLSVVKIGDVCDLMTGGTPRSNNPNYYGGNIKWLVSGDIHKGEIYDCDGRITELALKDSNAKILPVNSVLIALNGQGKTRGTVALLRVPATCNQSLISINPKNVDILLPEFLYYYLKSQYKEIRNLTGDNQRSGLNMPIIRSISIPLPSIDVQKQIIAEIKNFQKVIDGARQVVENWKPYIDIDTKWEIVKLGNVCDFSGGTQPPKSTFIDTPKEGYIRLLQIRDYKSDKDAIYIPKSKRHKTCNEQDIMIGRYGPPVFQILRGKAGAYNVALMKCLPDKSKIINDWLYYFLLSDSVQERIISLSERVRQSGVLPSDLKNLDIPLPNLDIQKQIVGMIEEQHQVVDGNKKLIDLFESKIETKVKSIWES